MVEYLKSEQGKIVRLDSACPGCWINLINPTNAEVEDVISSQELDAGFVRAALDPEESSRVELEDDQGIVEQDMYFKLFKRFVDSIAIKERENEKLRLNMLPNRYREFMPEVEYKSKTK